MTGSFSNSCDVQAQYLLVIFCRRTNCNFHEICPTSSCWHPLTSQSQSIHWCPTQKDAERQTDAKWSSWSMTLLMIIEKLDLVTQFEQYGWELFKVGEGQSPYQIPTWRRPVFRLYMGDSDGNLLPILNTKCGNFYDLFGWMSSSSSCLFRKCSIPIILSWEF